MRYTAEIDAIDQGQWDRLLLEFDDASIFQTWAYGAAHWGEHNLSHAVIMDGGEVVALAQAVLIGVPLLGKILAYVIFGPVWQRQDAGGSIEHLQAAIAVLREEYSVRRRLCLRLRFWAHDLPDDARAAILAGDVWKAARPLHRTYILDLSPSEGRLRAAMDRRWRANLRKAERAGLLVSQQNDQDGLRTFVELYNEMQKRKRFASPFIGRLPEFYRDLPDRCRPSIFICRQQGRPLAAAIVSGLGNRAFSLSAASGDAALEARAGYWLQWSIVRWLKEDRRYRWYDLRGGTTSTDGIRRFKRGLVGARAQEVAMTELEAGGDRLSTLIVDAGSRLYELHRKLKGPLDRLIGRA